MCLNRYGEIIQIQTIIVDISYRREGIGSQLIEFAKDFWRKRKEMVLHVGSFFEYDVYDFYIKQGFKEDGICSYKDHKCYQFVLTDKD